MILNNCFTHILWMLKLKTENLSGNYQKDRQLQLNKLIQPINFMELLFLLMLFFYVKYSMLSIQKILEKNKGELKYAKKLQK